MTQINWGMLQPVDVGGAFQQGLAQGRQARVERETDNALRALIANPDDPNAVNALAQYDPRAAYGIQQQQQQRQAAAHERDVRMRAAQGDPQARTELAAVNWDDYRGLAKDDLERAKEGWKVIGQAALMADTAQEWDRLAGILAQQDPSYQQYVGRFDLRDAVIAQAGEAKAELERMEPKYQVVPEGGMLVNTKDPAALAQVGAGSSLSGTNSDGSQRTIFQEMGMTEEQAAPIIADAARRKVISPEDFAAIQQSLGPNGQAAAQQWMQEQGIQIGKQIGGKRYVQRGGDWYGVD